METELRELTVKIVAAYAGHNRLPAAEMASVITTVYSALVEVASGGLAQEAPQQSPAVPVKKSVAPDHIVCLECGKKLKMLKRHLATDHGLTVQDYRSKWGLPADYPTTAPAYTASRSQLAIAIGLGRKRAVAAPETPAPKRGRRKAG